MNRLYGNGELIYTIPEDDDYNPPEWQNTNCRNCGAPLTRGQVKCEYCDTSRQLKSQLVISESKIQFSCF